MASVLRTEVVKLLWKPSLPPFPDTADFSNEWAGQSKGVFLSSMCWPPAVHDVVGKDRLRHTHDRCIRGLNKNKQCRKLIITTSVCLRLIQVLYLKIFKDLNWHVVKWIQAHVEVESVFVDCWWRHAKRSPAQHVYLSLTSALHHFEMKYYRKYFLPLLASDNLGLSELLLIYRIIILKIN